MSRLDGRVVVITGAGRGIGASLARTMAREGAAVVVNDIGGSVEGSGQDQAPATEVVAQIRKSGGRAVANFGDISAPQDAENLIETALREFGRLDVLINTAGILRDRMVFNMSEEEWDAVIRVHLKGTFLTTRAASIHWRQAREGHYRLINFSSASGLHGSPGQPNYAAAKMGIVGFTWSCANGLARYGVTANAIAPGAATRMLGGTPFSSREDDPQWSPDNVAPPLVYLASKESDWLTGRVIGVRGYQIQLYNNPAVIRELRATGPWSIDDCCEQMERSFRPAVEGGLEFRWPGLEDQKV